LPEDYRREWSAHFAREDEPGPPARSSALLFRIRLEWLGLPTQAFQEVAERKHIHPLPHRRQGTVLGLANIRGELLICVDLGRLLGLGSGLAQDLAQGYDRLLVVNWEGQRLVFPVDEVHGIHRFQSRELKAPPATVAKSAVSFSRGVLSWQQKSVGFLDAPTLFTALDRSLS
jgi:chemotaxis-related protein WspD